MSRGPRRGWWATQPGATVRPTVRLHVWSYSRVPVERVEVARRRRGAELPVTAAADGVRFERDVDAGESRRGGDGVGRRGDSFFRRAAAMAAHADPRGLRRRRRRRPRGAPPGDAPGREAGDQRVAAAGGCRACACCARSATPRWTSSDRAAAGRPGLARRSARRPRCSSCIDRRTPPRRRSTAAARMAGIAEVGRRRRPRPTPLSPGRDGPQRVRTGGGRARPRSRAPPRRTGTRAVLRSGTCPAMTYAHAAERRGAGGLATRRVVHRVWRWLRPRVEGRSRACGEKTVHCAPYRAAGRGLEVDSAIRGVQRATGLAAPRVAAAQEPMRAQDASARQTVGAPRAFHGGRDNRGRRGAFMAPRPPTARRRAAQPGRPGGGDGR